MNQDTLRKVQLSSVGIAKEIHRICKENDIQYSLTGGSVIGYHLYKGVIPWDDDVDIMMTRDNYEKFLSACKDRLSPRYSLDNFENQKDKTVLFSKVVDQNTTVVEKKQDGREIVGGVFADITVMDRVPQGAIRQKYFVFLSQIVQFCRERNYEKVKSWKSLIKNVGIFLFKPFSNVIYPLCKKQLTSVPAEKSAGYAEYFAGITKKYKIDLFEQYSEILFEGERLMIVSDYMQYLETRYNKRTFYKEQRAGDVPHHLIYANCEMPFKEYLAKHHV